jgi:hypothetical protein
MRGDGAFGGAQAMKIVLLVGSVLLYFVLDLQSSLTPYESMSVALFVYWLFLFLYDLGRKFIILDIIILSAIFSCLIMPMAGFHYFKPEYAGASLGAVYARFVGSVLFLHVSRHPDIYRRVENPFIFPEATVP